MSLSTSGTRTLAEIPFSELRSLADEQVVDFLHQKNAAVGGDVNSNRNFLKLFKEEEAFLALREKYDLSAGFPNSYIAIHEGSIVGSDRDQFELAKRMGRAYPHVAILIRTVNWSDEAAHFDSPECAG